MGRAAIKAACAAVLNAVDGIGEVETRAGRVPAWSEFGGAVPFWEIGITGEEMEQIAADKKVDRPWLLTVEGWFPRDYDTDSDDFWCDLIDAVELALLNNHRTMSGTWTEATPPTTVADELAPRPDGIAEPLCHHILIQIRATTELAHS